MKKFIKDILLEMGRDRLASLLIKIVPDMPDDLKKNLNCIDAKVLVGHILGILEKKLQLRKETGLTIEVKKGNPSHYRIVDSKTEKKTIKELFGSDEEIKQLCLKVPRFLKGKDASTLSSADSEALSVINQKALFAIKEKYPDVYKVFKGFQLTDDYNNVFVTVCCGDILEFDNLDDLKVALFEKIR